MSDLGETEVEGDLRMSPEAADLCRDQQEARDQYHGSHDAPPPRFFPRFCLASTYIIKHQIQLLQTFKITFFLGEKAFRNYEGGSPRRSGVCNSKIQQTMHELKIHQKNKIFRFSFNGSLSEFSTAWPGGEDGGGDRANGERPPWDLFLIVGWSSLEASLKLETLKYLWLGHLYCK